MPLPPSGTAVRSQSSPADERLQSRVTRSRCTCCPLETYFLSASCRDWAFSLTPLRRVSATIMSGLLGACVSTTSHVVELALPYLIPTPPAGSEKRFCGERLNAEMKMVIVRLTRIEALSAAELRFYPMSATTTHV